MPCFCAWQVALMSSQPLSHFGHAHMHSLSTAGRLPLHASFLKQNSYGVDDFYSINLSLRQMTWRCF